MHDGCAVWYPMVYLKTPNAPGQRAFSRCAAPFFLEIRQYSCVKMSCSTQKFLAAGHIGSFQIHPRKGDLPMCAQKLSFDYAHTLHTVRIVHNAHSVHRSRVQKGKSCDCINFVRATDPPYNTGNDFVYEDDFAQSTDEYLTNSGQFDENGNRLVPNTESNGRFHMSLPTAMPKKAWNADSPRTWIMPKKYVCMQNCREDSIFLLQSETIPPTGQSLSTRER